MRSRSVSKDDMNVKNVRSQRSQRSPGHKGHKSHQVTKVTKITDTHNVTNNEVIPANERLISEFLKSCRAEGLGELRISKYLLTLRRLSSWLARSFEDASREDLEGLMVKVRGQGYKAWTVHDYAVALKKFYKWLNDGEVPVKIRWLKARIKRSDEKLPSQLLTEDDVKRMVGAASHPRDKAFIAVLFESGCRIGELLGLKWSDVSFDGLGAVMVVKGKTGMRRVRLISSAPLLRQWREYSPVRGADGVVWINILKGKFRNKPLEYAAAHKMLRVTARAAGVSKPVNPHAFRHSRASVLAGVLTAQELDEYMGWVQGSGMSRVYVHLNGRSFDDKLARAAGVEVEARHERSVLKPKVCARCGESLDSAATVCWRCGLPVGEVEVLRADEKLRLVDQLMDGLVEDADVVRVLARVVVRKNLKPLIEKLRDSAS